ncbi:dCTP deaminase [Nocardia sp. CDC186]|uniref:dCTP deaminase n=1 Tax=Nocardia implantans TaxID=3108168 RepID=A0ABU6B0K5_9NOCA|nr:MULTISPECIES: dCTP deaminase [unclassified Nocardia]MBF6195326.1 dCTP deaminase [Nocardia beijingensis]MEA3528719.1 dCTP deaminase [Nocardia sp. CDC192]MEB3513245.1 dCTP deaminase [Nocardia sp. CDC186]
MILTGSEIESQVAQGRIIIDPFQPEQLNPNSYNFRLGNVLKVYSEAVLDVRKPNPVQTVYLPEDGMVLQPDRIYLGSTVEVMGSDHYVPIIRARSGVARLGLFIHITADLIDIGSVNQWTLQLHAVQPLRIYPGMLLGQVTFWRTEGPVTLYSGKYQGSMGPQESAIHLDFDKSPREAMAGL